MRAWAASSSQDEEDPPRRLDPVPESSVAGEPSGSEDGTEPKYVSCRIPIFDPSASRGTPRSPPPLPSPAPSPPHPPSPLQLPDAKEPKRLLPSFRPLPSLLVFPNLPLLAFWLFALGITQKATSLLAFASAEGGIACGGGCVLLAALTLIFVAASVLLGLAMLLRFARRYHTACWKPNAKGGHVRKRVEVRHVAEPNDCHTRELVDAERHERSHLTRGGGVGVEPTHECRTHELDAAAAARVLRIQTKFRARLAWCALDVRRVEKAESEALERASATVQRVIRGKRSRAAFVPVINEARRDKKARIIQRWWRAMVWRRLVFGNAMRRAPTSAPTPPPSPPPAEDGAGPTARWKPNAKGIRRAQGSWIKPPEDMAEPARTERLLARRSFDPFYEQSADCQQSMSLHLLDGTTGRYRIGVGFAWVGIVMQVMIGLLSGVGPYLSKGGGAAKFQVLAVGGVKLLWASLLACFCPCADLVMNAVTACVFLLEGTSVVMLCIAQWSDEISSELVDSLQIASFVLLLISVFLPILRAACDGIVTTLPKLLARSSGGATGAGHSTNRPPLEGPLTSRRGRCYNPYP